MFHIPKTKDDWHTLTFGKDARWKKTARVSVGIGTVLAGLGYGGPLGWREFVTKPRERERWGTLEQPKFRVTNADVMKKGGLGFSILLETLDKNAASLCREFDQIETLADRVESLLASHQGEKIKVKGRAALSGYRKKLAALAGVAFEPEQIGAQAPSSAPAEAFDLSNYIPGCSKQAAVIFKNLTGQEPPEGIAIKIDNDTDTVKERKRLGYTLPFSSNIYLYSQNQKTPEDIVSTLIHEKGHLVCPISREEKNSPENRARDEACAFGFEMGGVLLSNQDSMKAAFEERYYSWMIDWYDNQNTDPHAIGAAICDAAISIHGGPGAAFNSLSTAGQIDPMIMTVMAKNQSDWDQNKELRHSIGTRALRLLEKLKKIESAVSE